MPRPILLLALAACTAREVQKQDPVQEREELKIVPVWTRPTLDLLFVIDDSGSMAEEQAALTASFPVFIDVLAAHEGGLPDVHIGVVSSNLGAGPYLIAGCDGDGDGGALLVGDPSCRPGDERFLRNVSDGAGGRLTNYPGTLGEAFACNATLGTDGCGFEQHLEAMRRALDGSNPENAGFLRDDAYLAVVFIADEDDCSTADPALFAAGSGFACFEHGVDCETGNDDPRAPGPRTGCSPREGSALMYGVDEYVDFLKGLKDDTSMVIVSLIAGNPEPVAVGEGPALLPSCESASGSATPAVRLTRFAGQFPNRNAFTTICNDDLSDALFLLGWDIREAIGNPCIETDLVDVDPATPGLQVECVVSDVVNPGTDEQEETLLPRCDQADHEDTDPDNWPVSTNFPCWHLIEDRDACPETPTGLTLIVERGDTTVPRGTYVQARCRA